MYLEYVYVKVITLLLSLAKVISNSFLIERHANYIY